MAKVEVILVNWNGKKIISECLDGLRQQTYRDFVITVVDNGSSDGSVEWIKKQYPEVHVIPLDHNSGFCMGNNMALAKVKTEYVALLNNDAVAFPEWLSEMLTTLEKNPEAGFAASQILFYDDPEIIDRAGDSYTIAGVGRFRGRDIPAMKYNGSPQWVFGASAAAALYRVRMLQDIGFFDEDFFLIHEDVDLSFRAQLAGYKCIYVPSAKVLHKVSNSIGKDSDVSVYYGHRNLEWVFLKNMPAKLIPLSLFFHIIYDMAAFIYFILGGKGKTFLRAKIDALKQFSKFMEKRKQIQGRKKVGDMYIWNLMDFEWLFPRRKLRYRNIKWPIRFLKS